MLFYIEEVIFQKHFLISQKDIKLTNLDPKPKNFLYFEVNMLFIK